MPFTASQIPNSQSKYLINEKHPTLHSRITGHRTGAFPANLTEARLTETVEAPREVQACATIRPHGGTTAVPPASRSARDRGAWAPACHSPAQASCAPAQASSCDRCTSQLRYLLAGRADVSSGRARWVLCIQTVRRRRAAVRRALSRPVLISMRTPNGSCQRAIFLLLVRGQGTHLACGYSLAYLFVMSRSR